MTITGLSAFIKARFPSARRKVPVSFFAGKKVCVDGHYYFYRYLATAVGNEAKKLLHSRKMELDQEKVTTAVLERWIKTIIELKESGIVPIIVFDGPDVPIEKKETRERRAKGKAEAREEIAELRKKIAEEDLEADMESRERLVKLLPRDLSFSPVTLEKIKKLLRLSGITVIQASGEGEALCASLVERGECYAALTADSDMGFYRTARVIVEIEQPLYSVAGDKMQMCEVIYYRQVEKVLSLEGKIFTDFCIMCGTDYNDNVKGIGPATAYKLLQKHGGLDAIPLDVYDSSILNVERIREIASTVAFPLEGDVSSPPTPQAAELSQFLVAIDLLRVGGRLVTLLSPPRAFTIPPPINFDDADLL